MTENGHIVNKNKSRETQANKFGKFNCNLYLQLEMKILNPQNIYFKKQLLNQLLKSFDILLSRQI